MNRFFTFIFVFAAFAAGAQHSVTVSSTSDFKTIQDGKVESVFTLDNELTKAEEANFNQWVSDNASLMHITKSGLTITTSLPADYNDRNVYTKLFYSIGVDHVVVVENGVNKALEFDVFFARFNL